VVDASTRPPPADRVRELASLLAMARASSPPWHAVAALVGSAGTAHGIVTGEVPPINAFAAELAAAVTADDVAACAVEVDGWLARDDLTVWSVLDDDYPTQLRTVHNHPPLLFARGTYRDPVDADGLCVVGTRSASDLGLRRARRVAADLVDAGITVISGLALGIDTAAHTTALDCGGRTVAVLGGGLDHVYPAANRPLADLIVEAGGVVLSQYVPSQRPSRSSFPQRNITMSGLSRGTVIVEAGETSGTRTQARAALEHGRRVFILANVVDRRDWAREFVETGRYGATATVVRSSDDILTALRAPAPDAAPPAGQARLTGIA